MARASIIAGVAVVALAAGAAFYYRQNREPDQPGRGTPWTVLQDVELQHRSDSEHDSPVLLTHPEDSSFYVLGLPTGNSQFPRSWILLNEPTADRTFKQVPANTAVHVDCAYVDSLLASTPVEPPVQSYLKRHCGH